MPYTSNAIAIKTHCPSNPTPVTGGIGENGVGTSFTLCCLYGPEEGAEIGTIKATQYYGNNPPGSGETSITCQQNGPGFALYYCAVDTQNDYWTGTYVAVKPVV